MALLDAYATLAEYRARTGDQTTGANATLTAQLLGTSRLLEKALWVMPGAWNTHSGTYVFDAVGGTVLRLRDRGGLQYFLASITADSLKIDTDLDGSYDDFLLDTADAWVRGIPENAAAFSEPFRAIELRATTGATITTWPSLPGCVQIVGTWGYAAIPDLITELVCHRTNEMRESLKAGGTGTLPAFDAGVPMQPRTNWLWKQAEHLYGAKVPRSFAV